jgi:REP element-mobilizing transposase RayT
MGYPLRDTSIRVQHVVAAVNRKERIFEKCATKKLFMDFIEKAKKKFGFTMLNFTFMKNHVHFLLQPHDESTNISKLMQWLLGNFAKAWNKRHGLSGHLWRARFFSRIITDEQDFLNVFKYICDNPVKGGLVKDARDWEYSGLWHYIHGDKRILDVCYCIEPLYRAYSRDGHL